MARGNKNVKNVMGHGIKVEILTDSIIAMALPSEERKAVSKLML